MPTVPTWIGHSVVILPRQHPLNPERPFSVIHWRATTTQVVVQIDDGSRTQMRFQLEDLRGLGGARRAKLLDANDPDTVKRIQVSRYWSALNAFETAIRTTRLDYIRNDPEALVTEISKVRDAATAALASLAEVL